MITRRFKRKAKKFLLLFVVLLLAFALGFALYTTYPMLMSSFAAAPITPAEVNKTSFVALDEDPLSIKGFTAVAIEAVPGALLLKDNCSAVFIYMSNLKSFSIKRGLENTLDIRPNYHDLMYDIINHYDAEIIMVKVGRLKNNFYYADLFLEKEGHILHLDSRPSDAVGIASRFQAPIYVKDTLLASQAVRIC